MKGFINAKIIIMESNSNTLYGYTFSLGACKVFLQATTWLFGYSVARLYMDAAPAWEIPAAAVFGLILSACIDGPLSLLLADLLRPEAHPPYKWALAIGFSLLTASTTFVSGAFLGEAKANGLGVERREEILSEASQVHSERLSGLSSDLAGIEARISELSEAYRRDTALIISNMTPNHRMLYREGKHGPYLKSSSTLKENVSRIEALSTALQLELSSLKGRRYTITKARDQLAAADPEADGKEKIAGLDERNRKMGQLVSGSIYMVDIVASLLLWALFFLIREKVSGGAKLDIEKSSFSRWVMDRAAILQNKLLSAFSGADDEIADAARMLISIPVGAIQLLAWMAGLAALALTFPTRVYKPRPLLKKQKVSPPPHEHPVPQVVPVRGGQYDAYEVQRRIEMQEARIEMIRQEQERKEREQARQVEEERNKRMEAEWLRQIEADRLKLSEEKARQIAELSAKKKKEKTDRKDQKPVFNTDSGEVSAKVVGKSVLFDGKKYNLSELSKLTDRAATVYNRQFSLSTPAGRKKNADRWQAILPVLSELGYTVEYREGSKVSITGGKIIKA